MIVDSDTHPKNKIYYWGALVIEVLRKKDSRDADYFAVYEEIKNDHNISVEVFSLTLDWLFIIGVIDNKNGCIKKCF